MLKAIIIDDEVSCVDTLQLMLEKKFSKQVLLAGTANSAFDGKNMIEKTNPDIVFLDVEMPSMTGIELLQSLSKINFHVIFTTAHQHYAIQAIKLNALDYLTKPISLDELTLAIEKCKKKLKEESGDKINNFLQNIENNNARKIAIANGTAKQFVLVNEIVRVESQSNYSIIHFLNRPKQTVTKTLKELEEQLVPFNFIRVHHSHLVNIEHIIAYKNKDNGYLVVQGNEMIEISRRKKQEVMQKLNNL